MAIAFVTPDLYEASDGHWYPGGCAFYRCYLPMSVSGHKALLGRPVFDPMRGFGVRDGSQGVFGFRTVVLKLLMNRWTPRHVEIAKQLGQRIIVDIDDHFEQIPKTNLAYEITNPETNAVTNRDHYLAVIERADVLTVSTPTLYETYKDRHRDVRMIRNGIFPEMFHEKRHKERPIIGWVGATSYRGGDLELLREWLPQFLVDNDLLFHHSGATDWSPSFADIVGIPAERYCQSPLLPIDEYQASFSFFDIGLVPLTDIPFNHAKSCVKGLEYAAAGIPFISSRLPEYEMLNAQGIGRIADSPEEWMRHIRELLDRKVRKREAAENKAIVTSKHSIYARAEEWQRVFKEPVRGLLAG